MYEKIYQPTQDHRAKNMGSGGLEVLATPALVAFMENLCYDWLQTSLNHGQSSVGTHMAIEHLAACLVTQPIQVCLSQHQTQGRRHDFELQAYAKGRLIATAHHTRYIVDTDRFLGKIPS